MKNFLLFIVIAHAFILNTVGQCPQNTNFTFRDFSNPPVTGDVWCVPINFLAIQKDDANVFGTFSSTPVDLFPGTAAQSGFINLIGVTESTYQITFQSRDCSSSTTRTLVLTESPSVNAAFEYDRNTYCEDEGIITPEIFGDSGGKFTANPDSLIIDINTGAIDLGDSPNDTYTVTYTVTKQCGGEEIETSQTDIVRILKYELAEFTYGASVFCKDDMDPSPFVPSGLSGTYEAVLVTGTPGNKLKFSTNIETPGLIELNDSKPGVYDVTFTPERKICAEESHTERIEIVDVIDVIFEYPESTAFCAFSGSVSPIAFSFTSGGEFSATPAGLEIDVGSGVVNLADSEAGIYNITYNYTESSECGGSHTMFNVQVKIPEPTVSQLVQEFCSSASPTVGDLFAQTLPQFGIRWYDSDVSTTVLNDVPEGDPLPALTTATYYVATYSSTCDAETARIAVDVRVYDTNYPLIAQAAIDGATFNNTPTTITLTEGQVLSLGLAENFSETTTTVSWIGPNGFSDTGITALVSGSLAITDAGVYTATATFDDCAVSASIDFNLTVNSATVQVSPQVYLQGAMLGSTDGLMRDDLRTLDYLPTTSPYADAITVAATIFDDNTDPADDIVDWIWVELRDAAENTIIIAGQSALLQRDGDVVNASENILEFATPNDDYFVVIKHRNHLGIMSKDPISLSSTTTIVNFTSDAGEETFGTEAQTSFGMPIGTLGMWTGDANGDGEVAYLGANADILNIKDTILSDSGNLFNTILFSPEGYFESDLNLDGKVVYLSNGADIIPIKDNILNSSSNLFNTILYIITEKLP